jgi:hypothetical protein
MFCLPIIRPLPERPTNRSNVGCLETTVYGVTRKRHPSTCAQTSSRGFQYPARRPCLEYVFSKRLSSRTIAVSLRSLVRTQLFERSNSATRLLGAPSCLAWDSSSSTIAFVSATQHRVPSASSGSGQGAGEHNAALRREQSARRNGAAIT